MGRTMLADHAGRERRSFPSSARRRSRAGADPPLTLSPSNDQSKSGQIKPEFRAQRSPPWGGRYLWNISSERNGFCNYRNFNRLRRNGQSKSDQIQPNPTKKSSGARSAPERTIPVERSLGRSRVAHLAERNDYSGAPPPRGFNWQLPVSSSSANSGAS